MSKYEPHQCSLTQRTVDELHCAYHGRVSLAQLTYKLYDVKGDLVRDLDVDIDLALGGNSARYRYVPELEVWIEDTLRDKDKVCILVHEVSEDYFMRMLGMSYDDAHQNASCMERKARSYMRQRTVTRISESTQDLLLLIVQPCLIQ